jgi:hypothetical protein
MPAVRNRLLEPRELSAHPVDVGLRTEAAVAEALLRRGHTVLFPRGENQRYDMLVDLDGTFLRIQCKTGRLRRGAVEFSTQSVRCNMTTVLTRGYRGEVEYFGVYCPDNGRIYFVPIEEASLAVCLLRVDPPINGQAKRIRWAADYELAA